MDGWMYTPLGWRTWFTSTSFQWQSPLLKLDIAARTVRDLNDNEIWTQHSMYFDVDSNVIPGQLQMPDCIVTLEPSVSEASYNS